MASKGKVRASPLSQQGSIKASDLPPATISLSFKHLHSTNGKFSVGAKEAAYFHKLLERFKVVCGLTWVQMQTTHKNALRCHNHEWSRTSEPKGFRLPGQLADCEGWQFQLSSNEHGRVHGFFLDEVFFVVWLDPDHELYPDQN